MRDTSQCLRESTYQGCWRATDLTTMACLACPGRMLLMLRPAAHAPSDLLSGCDINRPLGSVGDAALTCSRAAVAAGAAGAGAAAEDLKMLCGGWRTHGVGSSDSRRQDRQDMPPRGVRRMHMHAVMFDWVGSCRLVLANQKGATNRSGFVCLRQYPPERRPAACSAKRWSSSQPTRNATPLGRLAPMPPTPSRMVVAAEANERPAARPSRITARDAEGSKTD